VAGLWRGAATALLSGQSHSIVGTAGSEAARIALAAGDFGTVYQRVAVFDLLGMVAATERARGHLSLVELHVPDGTRLEVWYSSTPDLLVCKTPIQVNRQYDRTQTPPP
jgi:hypothetical protein